MKISIIVPELNGSFPIPMYYSNIVRIELYKWRHLIRVKFYVPEKDVEQWSKAIFIGGFEENKREDLKIFGFLRCIKLDVNTIDKFQRVMSLYNMIHKDYNPIWPTNEELKKFYGESNV